MKKQALTIFSLALACALSFGNAYCSEQKPKEFICNPRNHDEHANILVRFAIDQAEAYNGRSWRVHQGLFYQYKDLKDNAHEKCMATIERMAWEILSVGMIDHSIPHCCEARQIVQKMIDQREQANKEQAAKVIAAEQTSSPTTILQGMANLRINAQNYANENDGDN